MSKEIDFNKAPDGATHWNGRPEWSTVLCFYKQVGHKWFCWRHDEDDEWVECNVHPSPLGVFEIPAQWTIHNNDKPLRELSDEQYGKMRRAEDAGGVVEIYNGNAWVVAKFCLWMPKSIYRIKPKSERDAFIEQCNSVIGDGGLIIPSLLESIFDAIQRGDIKAPEVSK